MKACREEIEHAIDNLKRADWDMWLRRQWYKAEARRAWTPERKARWKDWKEGHSRGNAGSAAQKPSRVVARRKKVWIKGHVPEGFFEWVERYWTHDEETSAVLSGCWFEEWKR